MKIKKFQDGGMAPEVAPQGAEMEQAPAAEAGAPAEAEGGEQDPLMMIAQASMQALQSQNCDLAFKVCEAFLQLLQEAQGPQAPQGPVEEAPQGEPQFKCGGKLKGRKVKKACKGGRNC